MSDQNIRALAASLLKHYVAEKGSSISSKLNELIDNSKLDRPEPKVIPLITAEERRLLNLLGGAYANIHEGKTVYLIGQGCGGDGDGGGGDGGGGGDDGDDGDDAAAADAAPTATNTDTSTNTDALANAVNAAPSLGQSVDQAALDAVDVNTQDPNADMMDMAAKSDARASDLPAGTISANATDFASNMAFNSTPAANQSANLGNVYGSNVTDVSNFAGPTDLGAFGQNASMSTSGPLGNASYSDFSQAASPNTSAQSSNFDLSGFVGPNGEQVAQATDLTGPNTTSTGWTSNATTELGALQDALNAINSDPNVAAEFSAKGITASSIQNAINSYSNPTTTTPTSFVDVPVSVSTPSSNTSGGSSGSGSGSSSSSSILSNPVQYLTDKAVNALNNPGTTATNVAVGMIPGVGIANTLSGLLGGPTVGGTLSQILNGTIGSPTTSESVSGAGISGGDGGSNQLPPTQLTALPNSTAVTTAPASASPLSSVSTPTTTPTTTTTSSASPLTQLAWNYNGLPSNLNTYGQGPEYTFFTGNSVPAPTTAQITSPLGGVTAAARGGFIEPMKFAQGGAVYQPSVPQPHGYPIGYNFPNMAYTDGAGPVGQVAAQPGMSPGEAVGMDGLLSSPQAPSPAASAPNLSQNGPNVKIQNQNGVPAPSPIAQNPNVSADLGLSPLSMLNRNQ